MGIRFTCHACDKKLNVKSFLAGKRGICPDCNARFVIPTESGGTAEPVVKSSSPFSAGNGLNPGMNLGGASASVASQGSPSTSGSVARPATTLVSPAVPATAPASDPLSESPNAVWYVRPSTGGQFGPAAGDIMRQWIAEGRVAADSLVWREGWAEWQSASAQFPQLGSGQASPSIPAAAPAPSPVAAAPAVASRPAGTPASSTVSAAAPILGPSAQASSGPTLSVPKKSNGLTALMVIILVLVAIFLMVILAYMFIVRGGQDDYNEAQLNQRSSKIVQNFDQDACLES